MIKKQNKSRIYKINTLPLCAFTSTSWFLYYCSLYREVHNEDYHGFKKMNLHYSAKRIKDTVYPLIFDEKGWSAREFAHFIKKELINTKNNKKKFTIFSFSNKRNLSFMESIVDNYCLKYEKLKEKNEYEKLIHIPFYDLPLNDNDLFLIFNEIGENEVIKIIYNYGFVNYVRYVQKIERNNLSNFSFEESKYICKKRIYNSLKDISKRDKYLAKKIFTMSTKSTILWEPYVNNKKVKPSYVFDWRNEFRDIIKKFDLIKEDWFVSSRLTDQRSPIVSVRNLFS